MPAICNSVFRSVSGATMTLVLARSVMAAPDRRLRELIELHRDPMLEESGTFPWLAVVLGVTALLVVTLVILRLRRARPIIEAPTPEPPPEDALAALEAAFRETQPGELAATLTRMADILRRYLTRHWGVDCSSLTTRELFALCENRHDALPLAREFPALGRSFFGPADFVRFAGGRLDQKMLGELYEIACDFVRRAEPDAPAGGPGAPRPPASDSPHLELAFEGRR